MNARIVGLASASIAASLAVAGRVASARRERRRRLLAGEIRQLAGAWSTVGECRVFARTSAVAPDPARVPVVFVHGFGVSGTYLVPIAERLATEFPVYVPDLPGHGRSDTPKRALDIPALADALVAWMDANGLERAALVANSMGCQTVVDAAIRYPGRVDRLVLIGPTADPAGRSPIRLFARLLACIPFERLAIAWPVAVDYLRMGTRLIPEFRAMLGDPIEEDLPRVGVPTMLVRGGRDAIAPRRWVAEAAELAGTDLVVEIPGCGHAVNFSAAGPLDAAIRPFLRAASSACGDPTRLAYSSTSQEHPLSIPGPGRG